MISTKRPTSTLVIALSSSFVCDIHTSLSRISQVVETVHALIELDYRVILVTGGALGMGSRALAKQVSPESHAALTAVGQAKLIRLYSDLFARVNQPVGQLILTQPDPFLSCLDELCTMKVVPICHARFQCEETVAACLAVQIHADSLILTYAGEEQEKMSLGMAGSRMALWAAADMATASGVRTLLVDSCAPDRILPILLS